MVTALWMPSRPISERRGRSNFSLRGVENPLTPSLKVTPF